MGPRWTWLYIFFLICVIDSIEGFSRCCRGHRIFRGLRCCCDSCAKKACRAAAAYAAFDAATATTAASAASAVLLLSCCCAAAVLLLIFSVFLKKYDAVLRNANRSFLFSVRDMYFCDLTEFRRFAHRKHIQSDAGMNLAFFKFDIIIG